MEWNQQCPRPPNVPLFRALWSLLAGIWGLLKGSWGGALWAAGFPGSPCELGHLRRATGCGTVSRGATRGPKIRAYYAGSFKGI